jgi:hypothetical protein
VDMSNLGVGGSSLAETGRLNASLIKKCAILSMAVALDQLYTGKCDECCAMLRAFTANGMFTVNQSSVTGSKAARM